MYLNGSNELAIEMENTFKQLCKKIKQNYVQYSIINGNLELYNQMNISIWLIIYMIL